MAKRRKEVEHGVKDSVPLVKGLGRAYHMSLYLLCLVECLPPCLPPWLPSSKETLFVAFLLSEEGGGAQLSQSPHELFPHKKTFGP